MQLPGISNVLEVASELCLKPRNLQLGYQTMRYPYPCRVLPTCSDFLLCSINQIFKWCFAVWKRHKVAFVNDEKATKISIIGE